MKKRIVGIIRRGNKVLLMHRIRGGKEYYVFPGGSIEDGETEEEALEREIKEETSLLVGKSRRLFEIREQEKQEIYYLIGKFEGTPEVGSPEKERMSKQNQYHLKWVDLEKINNLHSLYPSEATKQLLTFLQKQD